MPKPSPEMPKPNQALGPGREFAGTPPPGLGQKRIVSPKRRKAAQKCRSPADSAGRGFSREDSPLPDVQTPPARPRWGPPLQDASKTLQDATDATRRFETLTETLPRRSKTSPRRPETPRDANFTAKMVPKTDPEISPKASQNQLHC